MINLRIVFMGTPDFAVATLDALRIAAYNVVGVITAVDKPAGRGKKVRQSAIKKYALTHHLPLLQPLNLKNEEFINELKALNANLQIVVAFRMLPKIVWQMPKYGTFNLHASLLPDYRGAAPINWAIINGESKKGVTTFFIDEKIDTGRIILQEEIPIENNETVGELHDKLMLIGSSLVIKTVQQIEGGIVKSIIQHEKNGKSAPKIFSDTCRINWHTPLNSIYNLIRGLNPYPTAWTILLNNNIETKLKIFDVKTDTVKHQYNIGLIIVSKKEIRVAVKTGFIIIKSLQLAGKRKMDSNSLLNGFTFYEGAKML